MDKAGFLDRYDPADYARPSLAVDLILMSIVGGRPAALLIRRDDHPHLGCWSLPGGFVAIDESLDAAAHRVLATKARMADAYVEQLYTFGAVDRDPRTRIVSVSYFALLPPASFAAALEASSELMLAELVVPWAGEAGGRVEARSAAGDTLPLAFDHADMLGLAMLRLRGKLDYSDVAFALLPERFTLRALQDVHEAILGARSTSPPFAAACSTRPKLEATGERDRCLVPPRRTFPPPHHTGVDADGLDQEPRLPGAAAQRCQQPCDPLSQRQGAAERARAGLLVPP